MRRQEHEVPYLSEHPLIDRAADKTKVFAPPNPAYSRRGEKSKNVTFTSQVPEISRLKRFTDAYNF